MTFNVPPAPDGARYPTSLRIPGAPLWVGCAVAVALVVGGLLATSLMVGWEAGFRTGALVAAAVTTALSMVGVAILGPGRERDAMHLMNRWTGATLVRLVVTPLVLFLLYSAAHFPARSIVIGGGTTYLALLAVETTIILVSTRRQLERGVSGADADDASGRATAPGRQPDQQVASASSSIGRSTDDRGKREDPTAHDAEPAPARTDGSTPAPADRTTRGG
jgi:hypothetical protein